MIRTTDGNAINVMENELAVEVCAKFTEPAAFAGVLTLFTQMTGEAICKRDGKRACNYILSIKIQRVFNVTKNGIIARYKNYWRYS